jgi:sugar fermentation stimulation protein A
MQMPSELVPATLIKRYKRFLADVRLDTGEEITASCPNTGSMMGLIDPGNRVWLSTSDSKTRKYRHTWELVEVNVHGRKPLVGINTGRPNKMVAEAIESSMIRELTGYASQRPEVKYGTNSRIDILLEDDGRPPCYVEVKNTTLLRQPGLAEFPDAVTSRGTKHLNELADMVRQGARAVMIYLVHRNDAVRFTFAHDIDPSYLEAYRQAAAAGVEALAYACDVTPQYARVSHGLPVELE